MRLPKDYAATKQEQEAVEYIWEQKGCVQQRHEPIVRCRDCKHYELQTVSYSDKPLSVCTAEWCEGAERDNPLVEPGGFCAWGERKADA